MEELIGFESWAETESDATLLLGEAHSGATIEGKLTGA